MIRSRFDASIHSVILLEVRRQRTAHDTLGDAFYCPDCHRLPADAQTPVGLHRHLRSCRQYRAVVETGIAFNGGR